MILRLVTSLVMTALGGTIGFALSDKLKNEWLICRAIVILLQRVSFLIGYRGDDVYSVCAELRLDSELKRLTFLQELPVKFIPECDLRRCWHDAVIRQGFNEYCEDILLRLGNIFGKSDCESQRSAISALIAETEQLSSRLNGVYNQKSRIYRTAGFLFGVMAGILVI